MEFTNSPQLPLPQLRKSAKAKREFDAMNGRAVPLLVVGEKRMQGFDAKRFEAMLAAR